MKEHHFHDHYRYVHTSVPSLYGYSGKKLDKPLCTPKNRCAWAMCTIGGIVCVFSLVLVLISIIALKLNHAALYSGIVLFLLSIGVMVVAAGFIARRTNDRRSGTSHRHRQQLQQQLVKPVYREPLQYAHEATYTSPVLSGHGIGAPGAVKSPSVPGSGISVGSPGYRTGPGITLKKKGAIPSPQGDIEEEDVFWPDPASSYPPVTTVEPHITGKSSYNEANVRQPAGHSDIVQAVVTESTQNRSMSQASKERRQPPKHAYSTEVYANQPNLQRFVSPSLDNDTFI